MVIALLMLAAGCGSPDAGGDGPSKADPDDTGTGQDTGGGTETFPCSPDGNLEIVPLDVWGRDLSGTTLTLSASPRAVEDADAGPGVVLYRLGDADAELGFRIEAEDHLDLAATAIWDGDALAVEGPDDAGFVAWSYGEREVGGTVCPVWTVYAGLEHAWFAPSAAAPSRNTVTFHMDGQTYWQDVADALGETSRTVFWTTWWWESDFELLRPSNHATLSESRRWENTALAMLDALPGVERRILINRFWADNSDYTEWLNTDTALLDYAEGRNDDFEVVLQGNDTEVPVFEEYAGEAAPIAFAPRVLANPRYADRDVEEEAARQAVAMELQVASWHQKAMVFDGQVAFVGGMNTKAADWDTNDHLVYDERRMTFEADAAARAAVAAKEELPELGPRKDYGVRVDGPAAADVEALLTSRWAAAMDEGALYAENATTPTATDPAAEDPSGPLVQVVATMPEPWATMAIGETHARAFQGATRFIYVEDQYFRSPTMNDLIVERMRDEPDLVLIVVTMDVSAWDGGAKYTFLADATFRELFPDRYLLLQLRAVDLLTDPDAWWTEAEFVAQDMDTHSKLRIVDDRYLSVGSCNFNNRGYLYEGELNVSILDEDAATSARERVFANLVGDEWAGLLSDDAQNNFEVLQLAAEENQARFDWWEENAGDLDAEEADALWSQTRPSGFVYPLEIGSDYEWDVGPDAF